MALSSESVNERAMALSLAESLRKEKAVEQRERFQQQSSVSEQEPSNSSRCQQPSHKEQQKQTSKESSGSHHEEEPQAKRMEGRLSEYRKVCCDKNLLC